MGALACGFHTVEAAGDKAELRKKPLEFRQPVMNEEQVLDRICQRSEDLGLKSQNSLYLLICVSLLF